MASMRLVTAPTYRQMQAATTRRRILDAARRLMRRDGWTATTITAIAADAGVAQQTVYAVFGNKRALLDGLREVMLRDSDIPALLAEANAEPDPAARLRLWARLVRRQMETSYDVIAIHREAARADPEAAAVHREVLDRRAATIADFGTGLEPHLAVDTRTAGDLLWAFSNEELWRELVEERRWTPGRFEEWLGRTLAAQLLRDQGT